MEIIKLKKKINDIETLNLDFDKINGHVLMQCAKSAKAVDKEMLIPTLSMSFQIMVAAKASGVKYDDLLNLSGSDFIAVTNKVLQYLNGVGEVSDLS